MGNKKDDYKEFCRKFAAHMTCEDDWWGMLVGGSDETWCPCDPASPRQESSGCPHSSGMRSSSSFTTSARTTAFGRLLLNAAASGHGPTCARRSKNGRHRVQVVNDSLPFDMRPEPCENGFECFGGVQISFSEAQTTMIGRLRVHLEIQS